MNQTAPERSDELREGIDRLRALRDEVRVRVHLAGMDAKDEWRELAPRLDALERAAGEASAATREALSEAIGRLTEPRSSLIKGGRAAGRGPRARGD
jgi:hypothetical protein